MNDRDEGSMFFVARFSALVDMVVAVTIRIQCIRHDAFFSFIDVHSASKPTWHSRRVLDRLERLSTSIFVVLHPTEPWPAIAKLRAASVAGLFLELLNPSFSAILTSHRGWPVFCLVAKASVLSQPWGGLQVVTWVTWVGFHHQPNSQPTESIVKQRTNFFFGHSE